MCYTINRRGLSTVDKLSTTEFGGQYGIYRQAQGFKS